MSVALACPHCGEAIVERRPLTAVEERLRRCLRRLSRNRKHVTYRAIADAMGWSSLGTVAEYMEKLTTKGYVVVSPELARARRARVGWELVE